MKIDYGSREKRCQTREEHRAFLTLTAELYNLDESDLQSRTGCIPSCSNFKYSTTEIMNTYIPIEVDEYTDKLRGLLLYFKASSYSVNEEVLRYGPNDVVGNIGGYLGLLLGVSALNVLHSVINRLFKGGRK